ncbi:hypothetical protein [Hamadaea tsunoensis]|uniref:hypothetical protein n=1 Tax=Hamadaea tsunoensis TaxID=53368 RepID=UPI0004132272|nr:hypothetical protein [Hamadaea tsunoensis]
MRESEPVSVHAPDLHAAAEKLTAEAYPLLVGSWDDLSRVDIPADPHAADTPGCDVDGAFAAYTAALAETVRGLLVDVETLAASVQRSAAAYAVTDGAEGRRYE